MQGTKGAETRWFGGGKLELVWVRPGQLPTWETWAGLAGIAHSSLAHMKAGAGLDTAAASLSVYPSLMGCSTDHTGRLHIPACAGTQTRGGPGGGSWGSLQLGCSSHLAYMRAKCVVDRVGLGHGIYWFECEIGLETELIG